jgi:hypothetical protein
VGGDGGFRFEFLKCLEFEFSLTLFVFVENLNLLNAPRSFGARLK